MRAFLVLALLVGAGCGDDSTMTGGGDLGAGDDLAAPSGADLSACTTQLFPTFTGVQTSPMRFDCPCGCIIDPMDGDTLNPMWGATHTANAGFAPMAGVGLGMSLTWAGGPTPEQAGLYSVGPIAQFFLDGDFDMLIDYDLATAPPGESHLVLSVRDPGTVQGLSVFEVERAHLADGTDEYSTMLGGVPPVALPTAATHGTLRLTRQGYTVSAYGDGQKISTLIAQKAGRVAVNLAATLAGCTTSDAGATCGYTPRWRALRLATGTLVNLP